MCLEVPHLGEVAKLINKHMELVWESEALATPSINDEFEILLHLMGLARIVEYNVRVTYEQIQQKTADENLPNLRNSKYDTVLKTLNTKIIEKNKMALLRACQHISNGMVHSDFAKVYEYTKSAYSIDGINFHYNKFELAVIPFQSTITPNGLNLLVKGDQVTATDNKGNEIPSKALIPDGSNEIHVDFKYLYQTGAFAFTFDVLLQGYNESVATMHRLRTK